MGGRPLTPAITTRREMTKRSKSYEQAAALVDREKLYTPVEAVKLAKQTTTTKRFDSTVYFTS